MGMARSRSTANRFPALAISQPAALWGSWAGLALAAPFTGATIGALVGSAGAAAASKTGISEAFIEDVGEMMKPGASALFVLDDEGDMEVILHKIRGLGGSVLKTNVDRERAKLIQSTLAASPKQE